MQKVRKKITKLPPDREDEQKKKGFMPDDKKLSFLFYFIIFCVLFFAVLSFSRASSSASQRDRSQCENGNEEGIKKKTCETYNDILYHRFHLLN